MMYRIIGADGREYGPVPAAVIRQWIAEGRVNAHSHVRPEGGTAWVTVSSLPEFGAVNVAPPGPGAPPVVAPLGEPVGLKSKLAAGLLGVLLGGWGIHRFYLGYIGIGIAQIFVTLFTCGVGALWGFIEGILILCGSTIRTDAEGRPLQD
jgi:TM2 domain-containing membrane protein YozV